MFRHTKNIIITLLLVINLASVAFVIMLFYKRNVQIDASSFLERDFRHHASDLDLDGDSSNRILPVSLTVGSLNINLPVFPSKIENGVWEEIDYGVSYLESTPLPGNEGNSVIYGHNWPNLLGNLKNINKNSEIRVKFSDNSIKEFIVVDTFEVTSDQVHILDQTSDTRLTIYTCDGFFDSKRFVVIGVPKYTLSDSTTYNTDL